MSDSRFDAAVAIAVSQGRLSDPSMASRMKSGSAWEGYVLRSESGDQLCVIPLEVVDGDVASALIPLKTRFQAAVEIAISRGRFRSAEIPCEGKSNETYGEYIIRSEGNVIVARILSRDIDAYLEGKAPPNAPARKRKDSDTNLAVAWARSMGYPVPKKPGGCLVVLLVTAGLFAAVVPGLLILIWAVMKQRDYERDIKALVEKWVDAGRPQPGIQKELAPVEKSEPPNSGKKNTEERLQELNSMKEKGLITEAEYDTLRNKALGL